MTFSPSVLTFLLSLPFCDGRIRRSLIDKFRFESEEWPLLDRVRLPDNLPATRDPLLLALRRLVRRNFEGLRERHRYAAENAEKRPFGLQYLVLEEDLLQACLDIARPEPRGHPSPRPRPAEARFSRHRRRLAAASLAVRRRLAR